jgi:predicted NUDIX family NTP pyrophosphohydrolase
MLAVRSRAFCTHSSEGNGPLRTTKGAPHRDGRLGGALGEFAASRGPQANATAPSTAAGREFFEETGVEASGPFLELGSVRLKSGKVIHAWAWEGDADAAGIRSNEARLEWPRGSGRWITYPEVDSCGWFPSEEARRLLNPSQAGLIERLERLLETQDSGFSIQDSGGQLDNA